MPLPDSQVIQAHGFSWGDPGSWTDAAYMTNRQLVVDTGNGMSIVQGQSLFGNTDPMPAAPNDYYALWASRHTFTGNENADSIQAISAQCRYQTVGGEAIDITSSTATGGAGPWGNNIQALGAAAGHLASGTLTWARVYGGFCFASVGAGTITNAAVFYAYDAITNSVGQITNQFGLYVVQPTRGTNNVGAFIAGGSTFGLWVAGGITWFQGLVRATAGLQLGDGTNNESTLWSTSGVPSNTLGSNGDYAFRIDGGANTHLYFKSAGAWAAVI